MLCPGEGGGHRGRPAYGGHGRSRGEPASDAQGHRGPVPLLPPRWPHRAPAGPELHLPAALSPPAPPPRRLLRSLLALPPRGSHPLPPHWPRGPPVSAVAGVARRPFCAGMAEALSELAALLGPAAGTGPAAAAARAGAAEAALSLSGSAEGRRLLAAHPAALAALLELAAGPCPAAGGAARRCLVNVAAEAAARGPLLAALPALLGLLPAGPACGALANLCREPGGARRVLRGLRERGCGLEPLLRPLGEPRPPAELGPLLCNLSQVPEGRRALLDRSRCVLFPLSCWGVELLARGRPTGAGLGALRWLLAAAPEPRLFLEYHEWLLGDEVDILPFLLLPLAGPEEFPEDEMERLPVDLQYLPPDKQREEEPDIRKMLLEAIMLVAPARCLLQQEKGTYLVLRELHRWEREPDVLAACEKLIQVLIGDEPGPGMENLLEVSIPEDVEQQLQRLDREEEERWQREREEQREAQEQREEPSR
uniref:HGH1 homolog n=1 Tax=Anser brachyrhynchus TaxID=132585 RepID=A0A8B9I4L5_9AVES